MLFNKFIKYRANSYYIDNNDARSVIIVNNIKIFNISKLEAIYKEVKNILAYLPTFTANLNPIETLFAVIKV